MKFVTRVTAQIAQPQITGDLQLIRRIGDDLADPELSARKRLS
jgi:hypothetical protein